MFTKFVNICRDKGKLGGKGECDLTPQHLGKPLATPKCFFAKIMCLKIHLVLFILGFKIYSKFLPLSCDLHG